MMIQNKSRLKMHYKIETPLREASTTIRLMRHGSPSTRRAYNRVIRSMIKDLYRLGKPFHSIKETRPDIFVELVAYWRTKNLKISTMSNRIAILRKYLAQVQHAIQPPNNKALGLVYTKKNDVTDTPVCKAFVNEVDNKLVKIILRLQIYFGLTRNEAIQFDITSVDSEQQYLIIRKKYAHNSIDRLIPIYSFGQKDILQQLQVLLGNAYRLADLVDTRIIYYLYYGELGLGGYKTHAPFRKLYINTRYQSLAQINANSDITILKQIAKEMGLSDIRQVKKWIKYNEQNSLT
jgi:hypothetical protein